MISSPKRRRLASSFFDLLSFDVFLNSILPFLGTQEKRQLMCVRSEFYIMMVYLFLQDEKQIEDFRTWFYFSLLKTPDNSNKITQLVASNSNGWSRGQLIRFFWDSRGALAPWLANINQHIDAKLQKSKCLPGNLICRYRESFGNSGLEDALRKHVRGILYRILPDLRLQHRVGGGKAECIDLIIVCAHILKLLGGDDQREQRKLGDLIKRIRDNRVAHRPGAHLATVWTEFYRGNARRSWRRVCDTFLFQMPHLAYLRRIENVEKDRTAISDYIASIPLLIGNAVTENARSAAAEHMIGALFLNRSGGRNLHYVLLAAFRYFYDGQFLSEVHTHVRSVWERVSDEGRQSIIVDLKKQDRAENILLSFVLLRNVSDYSINNLLEYVNRYISGQSPSSIPNMMRMIVMCALEIVSQMNKVRLDEWLSNIVENLLGQNTTHDIGLRLMGCLTGTVFTGYPTVDVRYMSSVWEKFTLMLSRIEPNRLENYVRSIDDSIYNEWRQNLSSRNIKCFLFPKMLVDALRENYVGAVMPAETRSFINDKYKITRNELVRYLLRLNVHHVADREISFILSQTTTILWWAWICETDCLQVCCNLFRIPGLLSFANYGYVELVFRFTSFLNLAHKNRLSGRNYTARADVLWGRTLQRAVVLLGAIIGRLSGEISEMPSRIN